MAVALSTNKWTAALDEDSHIHVFDENGITQRHIPYCDSILAHDLCWQEGNQGIFTVGTQSSRQIQLWDIRANTGKPVLHGSFHKPLVKIASAGVGWAATGTADGDIVIWDIRGDGMLDVQTMATHGGEVNALAFKPTDKDILVSAGADGQVLCHDLRNGPSSMELSKESSSQATAVAYYNPPEYHPEYQRQDYLVVGYSNDSVSVIRNHPSLTHRAF